MASPYKAIAVAVVLLLTIVLLMRNYHPVMLFISHTHKFQQLLNYDISTSIIISLSCIFRHRIYCFLVHSNYFHFSFLTYYYTCPPQTHTLDHFGTKNPKGYYLGNMINLRHSPWNTEICLYILSGISQWNSYASHFGDSKIWKQWKFEWAGNVILFTLI